MSENRLFSKPSKKRHKWRLTKQILLWYYYLPLLLYFLEERKCSISRCAPYSIHIRKSIVNFTFYLLNQKANNCKNVKYKTLWWLHFHLQVATSYSCHNIVIQFQILLRVFLGFVFCDYIARENFLWRK